MVGHAALVMRGEGQGWGGERQAGGKRHMLALWISAEAKHMVVQAALVMRERGGERGGERSARIRRGGGRRHVYLPLNKGEAASMHQPIFLPSFRSLHAPQQHHVTYPSFHHNSP